MAMKFNLSLFLFFLSFLVSVSHNEAQVLDITNSKYGAKSDGSADMTSALQTAWKEACESTSPNTILIPKGTFALGVIKLEGPCKSPIAIELQGTLKSPSDPAQMNSDGWITMNHIDYLTFFGGGTLDGQGKVAWTKNDCKTNKACKDLPVSIRFNSISHSVVKNVTTQDSKNFHVNLMGCKNVTFERFNIIAPGDSPNTDGIHMGRNCANISIVDCEIKTGDDCISMGPGSANINITKVTCGPGHGISIGSLGGSPGEDPITGISVINCTFLNTTNGVRIKTWPKANTGTVSDVRFEDLIMQTVENPIIIDQEYCPSNKCDKEDSKVKISKVSIKNVKGSSATASTVKISCSKSVPCESVEVGDIDLSYSGKEGAAVFVCNNVKPTASGKQNPAICGATADAPGGSPSAQNSTTAAPGGSPPAQNSTAAKSPSPK